MQDPLHIGTIFLSQSDISPNLRHVLQVSILPQWAKQAGCLILCYMVRRVEMILLCRANRWQQASEVYMYSMCMETKKSKSRLSKSRGLEGLMCMYV